MKGGKKGVVEAAQAAVVKAGDALTHSNDSECQRASTYGPLSDADQRTFDSEQDRLTILLVEATAHAANPHNNFRKKAILS